jgi:predicted MFS family arabinose efflux permease
MKEVGYIELLRCNRNFRSLYLARLISLFGDWFNLLAVLALLRSIGIESAGSFGGVFIAKSLSTLIMLPYAGVFVDKFSRKTVMIASDIARALMVSLMFLVLLFPSAWLIYTLLIAQSAMSAFFEPARNAMLPDIVSSNELTAANALGAATWSAMLTIGAAAGGLFTEFFGWEAALVVDVLSYLVSAVFLLFIREPPFESSAKQIGLQQLKDGFLYIRSDFRIWTLCSVKMLWSIAGSVSVLLALLGEGKYAYGGRGMIGVSILFAARGLGTGLGPIIARWLSRGSPLRMEHMITVGFAFGAVFYMLLPFVDTIWLVCLLVILAHLGGATVWVFSTIRLQQLVPTTVRGRVFSMEQAAFLFFYILSTAFYSWVVDQFSVEADLVLGVMGVTLLIPMGIWMVRMRRIPVDGD